MIEDLEAVPDALILFDAQERVISANQAARVVLGLPVHDTSTPLVRLPVSSPYMPVVRARNSSPIPAAPAV